MNNFARTVSICLFVLIVSSAPYASATFGEREAGDAKQIVVAVTQGRVRSAPNLQAEILKTATIGTRFTLVEKKGGWSKILLSEPKEDEEPESGWISDTIIVEFDPVKPGVLYQRITDKYFQRESLPFGTAREIFEFLPQAADEAKTFEVGGDLRLRRLSMLGLALKAIPFGRENNAPYKEFLEKYKDDAVYSEPAGAWYVRSEKFWELHQRYQKYEIGEKIAWHAAGNPTPGECEGYINCHLYRLRITQAEYLNFYPAGKHSREALEDISNMLQPIVEDLPAKSVFYTASDISDRAEFNGMLADLRKIISKSPHLEKTKILKQIDRIAEGHR
jgi:hypothetical protein